MNPTTTGARFVRVPEGLVVLIGPPGSGKTRLRQKFLRNGLDASAVLCPDDLRALPRFGGDASSQEHNAEVFAYANHVLDTRLKAGQPVLFDATNLDARSRCRQVAAAKRSYVPATAFLAAPRTLDDLVQRTNDPERNRALSADVIARFLERFSSITVEQLYNEGFDRVVVFDDETHVEVLRVDGQWQHVSGPFAVISDVHNCLDTLKNLLAELGFDENLQHPDNLFPILNGDVIDKGGRLADTTDDPRDFDAARTLRWVRHHHALGNLGWVLGNHEESLVHALIASPNMHVHISAATRETVAALEAQSDAEELINGFLSVAPRLPTQLSLRENSRDVYVAHAGISLHDEEKTPSEARRFALHARESWIKEWRENATAVYGHVYQAKGPKIRTNDAGGTTVGIETSAWRGGGLTAYRTDTNDLVTMPSVPHDVAPTHRLHRYDAAKERESVTV